jgi:SpoVK/Ycf46/Vps4 family AAA+-type ATPase
MEFLTRIGKLVNSGQSRSIILTGNIHDLFLDGDKYVPLMDLLKSKFRINPSEQRRGITQAILEANRPIEIVGDKQELSDIWYKTNGSLANPFAECLQKSNESSILALEVLRQLTERMRVSKSNNDLLVLIEAADMIMPDAEISRMSPVDRKIVAIAHDWFTDPSFMNGQDTVILLSELQSGIHNRISKLPNVLSVKVPLPDFEAREQFILRNPFGNSTLTKADIKEIAEQTAGLSLHAVRQLLCSRDLSPNNIASKVEEYVVSQMGEGVVEFKRPTHTLKDVVGYSKLKKFFANELIPSMKAEGKDCIAGAAVSGPIGSGKTYICEALVGELGVPVITLKSIRSKWFGETDQIFERLRMLLESFHKIIIFVDEADTMFGDVQSDHDTERRLTGKIQSMMSDPALRGRVIWFLMTARIHRLSPDIRRPGRMDLIIPILDPEPLSEDHQEFVRWTFGNYADGDTIKDLTCKTQGYSSARFAALKSALRNRKFDSMKQLHEFMNDLIDPDISDVREYQILQAKLNCTRLSLLNGSPTPETRATWKKQIRTLETQGMS